jgi:hypothetical protein
VPGRQALTPLHVPAGVIIAALHEAALHSPSGFCPSGIARQRPFVWPVFVIAHAVQVPAHWFSQQTPSTQ